MDKTESADVDLWASHNEAWKKLIYRFADNPEEAQALLGGRLIATMSHEPIDPNHPEVGTRWRACLNLDRDATTLVGQVFGYGDRPRDALLQAFNNCSSVLEISTRIKKEVQDFLAKQEESNG